MCGHEPELREPQPPWRRRHDDAAAMAGVGAYTTTTTAGVTATTTTTTAGVGVTATTKGTEFSATAVTAARRDAASTTMDADLTVIDARRCDAAAVGAGRGDAASTTLASAARSVFRAVYQHTHRLACPVRVLFVGRLTWGFLLATAVGAHGVLAVLAENLIVVAASILVHVRLGKTIVGAHVRVWRPESGPVARVRLHRQRAQDGVAVAAESRIGRYGARQGSRWRSIATTLAEVARGRVRVPRKAPLRRGRRRGPGADTVRDEECEENSDAHTGLIGSVTWHVCPRRNEDKSPTPRRQRGPLSTIHYFVSLQNQLGEQTLQFPSPEVQCGLFNTVQRMFKADEALSSPQKGFRAALLRKIYYNACELSRFFILALLYSTGAVGRAVDRARSVTLQQCCLF